MTEMLSNIWCPQTGRPFIFSDINLFNMIFLDLNIELYKKKVKYKGNSSMDIWIAK